ncbi:MAG: VOC family protein [Nostoc sp.]|uniref:VOC family protein n=1 Tax=Nostoc sp. TaxID=1180 RepID=UPI002FFAF5E6
MVQVAKIGHAGFKTPDVEAMLAYYTEILGFAVSDRGSDGAVYLSCAVDHHTIILYPSTESGHNHFAFQINGSQTLKEAAKQLRDAGIQVEQKTDAQPGIPELLQFCDPEGHTLQLYSAIQQVSHGFRETGIVPEKLGHVAMYVHDVHKCVDFYQNMLGFRVSDWLEDSFVFMRCNPDHHTMNFLQSKQQKMFHIAFQLRDWAHMQTACDFLVKHNITPLWGPVRHGIGHNIATYHQDPDKNIVEVFTEIDIMLNEDLGYFEPRPWHEDFPQKPKVWKDTPQSVAHWGGLPPKELME